MAEMDGITDLQMVQQEKAILEKELQSVKAAEDTSVSCARVVASVQEMSSVDGFLEGGGDQNPFISTGPSAEEACCVML